ncbi:hypothetical protein AOL_s00004g30 [Orbilia oligospora ATCC 24927]|uniref:Phospholipid/glycerol acyltransferase domain-containing protein n=2 Tax=Orbilia oligospora TaxID=2813651 RepID=G1WXM0_ARTOA|nr:hypothetical protein AOL_s00004g30 [Orbilia oligospora ATCC 24927]EGX54381.1 hypothetical protein AOL_s00004g30 [Orbilia oligospora ATCC 24927]KAF3286267.1 hypothetical protein TWF970_009811 [Orbilia oligospora]
MEDKEKSPRRPPSSRSDSGLDIDILNQENPIQTPLVQDVIPESEAEAAIANIQVTADGPDMSRNIAQKHSHFRDHPIEFLREIQMMYSGTGWRAYDNPIGQPVYYNGFTDDMKKAILESKLVENKIQHLATETVDYEAGQGFLPGAKKEKRQKEVVRQLRELADRTVDGMICKMESKSFIRTAYWLASQVLSRTYHQGVHVSMDEVVTLTKYARKAAEEKQSMIFLPCHRSHIDYVSLQVICYRLGIALPAVIAGDNLNFPVVGSFLQNAGAFYIRRSMGDDKLYPTMVQGYVDTLLRRGYNMECFVEGTRSRTGKLLPPKFGILNFILSSILSGRVKDCLIVPVSTQYDKVIESESYINELLGVPKKKENLYDFLNASSVLSLKMGRVDVRFHEPWSLRNFILKQMERTITVPPTLAAPQDGAVMEEIVLTQDQRVRLLRSLGYKVLSDINSCSVVMPTALIGTVLLTLRGRGVGKTELIRRIEWLKCRIISKGAKVAHFGGVGTEAVVEKGLEVIGDLVGKLDNLAEETYYAVDRFQLSFYRNMVIHLFILEAVVCAAMYTKIKQGGGPANQRIGWQQLYDHVSFISRLFRNEFVFPTEGLVTNLRKTLRELGADDVINVVHSKSSPDEVDYVELSPRERERGRENYDFYCFMIWPFIEGVWLAGVAVVGITPPIGKDGVDEGWVDSKRFLDVSQLLGKTLYHQGDLSYFEAVNSQSLKNAFTQFTSDHILEVKNGKTRINPEWRPKIGSDGKIEMQGKLWEMVEKIAVTRREGKNRRDSQTVGSRVLSLAQKLGVGLFEAEEMDVKSEGKKKKKPKKGWLRAML